MSFLELTVKEPTLTIAPTIEIFGRSDDEESIEKSEDPTGQSETQTESELSMAGGENLSPTGLLSLLGVFVGIAAVVWLSRRRRS
jgi:hypothetical protein